MHDEDDNGKDNDSVMMRMMIEIPCALAEATRQRTRRLPVSRGGVILSKIYVIFIIVKIIIIIIIIKLFIIIAIWWDSHPEPNRHSHLCHNHRHDNHHYYTCYLNKCHNSFIKFAPLLVNIIS